MMTESEILIFAATGGAVRDFDGMVGIPTGDMQTDGETILAQITDGPDFSRWADTLDLEPVTA
jgi:hypothetical protein